MANSSDANRLPAIGQLVEDSVGADSQRIQAVKLSAKCISGEWFTLEQAKRVLDCVDQRPAQLEQVVTGSPGEDESGQRSAGRRPAIGQLASKLGEGDRLATLDLS